jgi:hypothetical protein
VWHASAASIIAKAVPGEKLRLVALDALRGVGDESLGQWEEWPGYAYHVRRRLTLAEQSAVGVAVDIRGTPEQERRWSAVKKFLPAGFKDRKG